MRILLVMPASDLIGLNRFAMLAPLGLETIAAYIAHHEVKIIDLRIEPDFENEMLSFQPDVVGIHCVSVADTYKVLNVAHKIKVLNPKVLTVVGGHPPSLLPEDFDSKAVDVIVIGDGEITFKELVDCYQARSDFKNIEGIAYRKNDVLTFNRARPLISNLDDTLLPNRELMRKYSEQYYFLVDKPMAIVPTSKGCPHRCKFCAIWPYNRGEYRCMGPRRVVTELSNIDAKNVFFADDNFFKNIKRANEIYEAIRAEGINKQYIAEVRSDAIVKNPGLIEKWRRIGMKTMGVGFEYIQNANLDEISKRNSANNNDEAIEILHGNDIRITGLFIVNPSFNESDFDGLLEYINKKKINFPFFAILTPLPGTILYKERYDELLTHNRELYNFLHAVLPTKLPREEFYRRFAQLYRDSWSASVKRDRKLYKDDIDTDMGYNIITAFKGLSDYRAYLLREKNQISEK